MEKENLYYMDKSKSKKNKKKNDGKKAAIIALAITTGVLGATTTGFAIGYGITQSQANDYGNRLESVYQKNFYDLVDSVNNTEIKLSKVLNSSSSSYQKKLLSEISKNATESESCIASLPLSQSDINESVRLVNQVSGYTSTLSEKLAKGGSLSGDEMKTLEEIYDNLASIKAQLNKFARKMQNGYSILDNSMNLNTKGSAFSSELMKGDVDIKYPTMIYDGPFADSVVDVAVKGLTGKKESKETAKEVISTRFKNIVELKFDSEAKGKFDTYNFRLKNSDDEMLYVQVSQIGAHILTVSGVGKSGNGSIEQEDAGKIALEFAKDNGIENAQIVWKDTIGANAYFNIAPVQNGITLYPDLVKVKVDLDSGTIIGYDATTYYTNHNSRTLGSFSYDASDLRGKIPSALTIVGERKCLAPLDYNREELCIEFECINDSETFYIYLNGQTGEEENILRVIKTDDGSKLL